MLDSKVRSHHTRDTGNVDRGSHTVHKEDHNGPRVPQDD